MPRLKILCLLLALAFLIPACGQEEGSETQTARIDALAVKSKDFALYDEAIEGFKGVFEGSTRILTMAGPDSEEYLLAEIHEAEPRVVLAVGLRAAKWIRDKLPQTPTVFCMAMHPEDNRLKTNYMTGVQLEPSPGDQLRAFARVLPDAARIGMLYDPKRTGRQVESIKKAAADLGIRLLARPVASREEVPAALEEVVAESQALWLLRDATVLTREFFNHTLMLQLFKRLPLITYSSQFVKKGAFFSYSASYQKQGREAAEIANRILSGASPADIPIQHPGGTLSLNLQTGERIGALLHSLRGHLPAGDVYLME
jgi:putative ABC transport system substrate-binding protein